VSDDVMNETIIF